MSQTYSSCKADGRLFAEVAESVTLKSGVKNATAVQQAFLNSLSVRVPLVKTNYNKHAYVAAGVQATLLRQTNWLKRDVFEDRHALLMHGSVSHGGIAFRPLQNSAQPALRSGLSTACCALRNGSRVQDIGALRTNWTPTSRGNLTPACDTRLT